MRAFYALPALALSALALSACGGSSPTTVNSGSTANNAANPQASCQTPPQYSVPLADLQASLSCSADLQSNSRSPILLVHGTAIDAENNWSWNYQPELLNRGYAVCTVEQPESAMLDIQISAEYVAYAIREMAMQSNKKVQIIGCSQGGMTPRWAFKYWPDLRNLVEDHIGLAPSNHGTLTARPACEPSCAEAFWQQRDDAMFIAALNDGDETFPEIDYTVVYTHNDEVVTPNADSNGSSVLRGGGSNVSNTATQDVCPANSAEHLALCTYDPVGFAMAIDALENDGPADPGRLDGASSVAGTASVCAAVFMPGVNSQTFAQDFAAAGQALSSSINNAPRVNQEPALRCYAQ